MSRPEDTEQSGLRVLVVDDERPALDDLSYLLDRDDRISRVITAGTAVQALAALRSDSLDAVFLDIAMPGLSGLDLAGLLTRFAEPPAVVFVTAHAEHAVDAFDLSAVDYLLKPVRAERLADSIARLQQTVRHGDSTESAEDVIAVELGGVTRLVHRSEVRYVEAEGDYSRLHTSAGSHLVRLPISALEERWRGFGFVRIHRSLLVALSHVSQVREDEGRIRVLVGERELQASRRLAPALRDQLRRTRKAGS